MDAVLRRYMDIIHEYVLEKPPPQRKPLFMPGDPVEQEDATQGPEEAGLEVESIVDPASRKDGDSEPPKKKQKPSKQAKLERTTSPNLVSMQSHLFSLLRPLVSVHHNVRDALARSRPGDIAAFENVLRLVEEAVKQGLIEYETSASTDLANGHDVAAEGDDRAKETVSSNATIARCKRPWWVCQPHIRPLPHEAFEKGALQLSKKEKARLAREADLAKAAGVEPEGRVETKQMDSGKVVEIPKEGMVCG